MRNKFIILLMFISVLGFTETIGQVEGTRGETVIVSASARAVSISSPEVGFTLVGRELAVFREVALLNIELAERASNIPLEYRRISGTIASSDALQKPLIFVFYSDGKDTQNIVIRVIDRRRNRRSSVAFSAEQMQALLNLLDEGAKGIERLNQDISSLNEIVNQARRYR